MQLSTCGDQSFENQHLGAQVGRRDPGWQLAVYRDAASARAKGRDQRPGLGPTGASLMSSWRGPLPIDQSEMRGRSNIQQKIAADDRSLSCIQGGLSTF